MLFRYQHDFGAVIRHNSRESRICFDHLRGECTRGSLCRFSHDLQPLIMQSLVPQNTPACASLVFPLGRCS